MASSCEDYRFQQQLLVLKKRLAEDKLNPEEREEIERLIQELERRLMMWKGCIHFSVAIDKKSVGLIWPGREGGFYCLIIFSLEPSWAMASIFALSFPMSPNNASGHFGVSLGKNEVFNTLYTIDGDKE
jgi:hypothetical protein